MKKIDIDTFFDKIFVINLDYRKDRWEHIMNEFKKLKITNFERFPAICPKYEDIPGSYYKNFNLRQTTKHIISQVGCKLSHNKILKIAKNRNYKKILILEDDAKFDEKFEEIWEKIIEDIQKLNLNWDMFYFGGGNGSKLGDISGKFLTSNIKKINICYTTHAYAINSNIFDYIINNSLNSGVEIDVFYIEHIQKNNKFKCYSANPTIISQYSNYSDILGRHVNYNK